MIVTYKISIHRQYDNLNENIFKKRLSDELNIKHVSDIKFIDYIKEDNYTFIGYSCKNLVGVLSLKRKGSNFEFVENQWSNYKENNWFLCFYGDRLEYINCIAIFPHSNNDITKVILNVNNKSMKKDVNLDNPSVINFVLDKKNINTDHPIYFEFSQ